MAILIVDDEEPIRRLLSSFLSAKHKCTTAESVASAARLLGTSSFRLVITDLVMPGVSGMELCKLVRREHPSTVVVLMSGSLNDEIIDEARAIGVFGFIVKPFELTDASETVEQALRHQESLSEGPATNKNNLSRSNDHQ